MLGAALLAGGCTSLLPVPDASVPGAQPRTPDSVLGSPGDALAPPAAIAPASPDQTQAQAARMRARLALRARLPAPVAATPAPAFRGPPAAYTDEAVAALVPASLWNRLRAGFRLPAAQSPRIDRQLEWFAAHPQYIERVVERARPLMHFILEQVETRGVPSEIALLPVVESAFNVFAYSHGRAAGLWQFIPATGRRFALKQNWWYDGRRDIVAATDAALTYLQELERRFDGDWLHALAAYNAGSGTVARAIRRNRQRGEPTDFWHLRVPRETSHYVPKLLALSRLIAAPARYGIELPDIADEPVLEVVDTQAQLDLAVAAELAGLPVDAVYRLNPGFNRWATDPDGPHRLLLPRTAAPAFASRLALLPPQARVTWHRHRVQSGETLSHIARRYRTTVGQLQASNGLRGHVIRSGHHLLVPRAARRADAYALSAEQRRKRVQGQARAGTRVVHEVRTGDTLWDLARRYGVHSGRIAAWNGLSVRDPIRPGQDLVLWLKEPAAVIGAAARTGGLSPDQARQRINYVVRRGDSLSRIASRFRVSVRDLRRWNATGLRGKYLQPGQRLRVYVDVRRQSS